MDIKQYIEETDLNGNVNNEEEGPQLYTIKEFLESVRYSVLTDDDGYGQTLVQGKIILPSQVNEISDNCKYVIWYNK